MKTISDGWEEVIELAKKHRMRCRPGNPTQLQERDDVNMFSMDVVALYPSIRKDMAVDSVRRAFDTTRTVFHNIDGTTLVRHVALTQSKKTLKDLKLLHVVPSVKPRTTFKSFIQPRDRVKQTNRLSVWNS